MKVKFGALVVEGRGKLGGHVASKNRAGSYFRTKVTPVNPSTSFQSEARNRLATLSQAWKQLTDAQRLSFSAAVNSFQKTDIFGDIRTPSGVNLFQKLNNNLLLSAKPIISEAPLPQGTNSRAIDSLTFDITPEEGRIIFTGSATSQENYKVYATPGQSPGKNFVKSEYRYLNNIVVMGSANVNIYQDFVTRFGVPVEGTKIFVKLVPINIDTGETGAQQSISTIVQDTV